MTKRPLAPLPIRSGLERYSQQAKDLVAAYKSGDPGAIRSIRQHHPRLPGRADTNDRNAVTKAVIQEFRVTSADAQAVVAHWHNFGSWQDLAAHVAAVADNDSQILHFEQAVEAIIAGDLTKLRSLLRAGPGLVRARSTRAHRATLLHYVGANGVEGYRQKTPKNAVAIARLLLKAGAEVDADLNYGSRNYPERLGSTTLGLVATSLHPAVAGVQIPLLKLLLNAGASADGLPKGWNPLIAALHNGRGQAARFLAENGARMDLEGAAGTGIVAQAKGFFKRDGSLKTPATQRQLELGFMWACQYGHADMVSFLLEKGMRAEAQPRGETGLHWAAYGGHAKIVRLLLQRNAPLEVKDRHFNGTPLGWALYGQTDPPPDAIKTNYNQVVKDLRAAGATVDPKWCAARNLRVP